MRLIKLTQNKSAIVDDQDYEKINKYAWHFHHNKRGTTGYALSRINNKHIRMHTFILGEKRGFIIDHIDGNGLNNTRDNLRFVTKNQNRWNVGIYKNNKTGLKGVSKIKGCNVYRSQIKVYGKVIYLGCFKDAQEAHKAYCEAAVKYHGAFAKF